MQVVAWLESLTDDVAITAVTLAELLAGVRRLPDGQRRSALSAGIDAAMRPFRDTRAVLPFDDAAADHYAEILAVREAAGLPISMADAQIAAICRSQGAVCATRNTRDFAHVGVRLVDPGWNSTASVRPMYAQISHEMIVEGEIAVPVPGCVLSCLTLRLSEPHPSDRVLPATTITGTTTWARFDPLSGLLETVIEGPGFRVLTQDSASAADPLPALGSPVTRRACLFSVGQYEFDAFGLPDLGQDWTVIDVLGAGPAGGLVLELEPCLGSGQRSHAGDEESTRCPPDLKPEGTS